MVQAFRSGNRRDMSRPGWPLMRRHLLFGLMTAAILGMCGVFGSVVYDSRSDVGRAMSTSAGNMAAAVAHDVDRNIELLDLSLQAITKSWSNPAVRAMDVQLRYMVLFDNALNAQHFGAILVLDQNGIVRADSRTPIPENLALGDRDYFRVHVGTDNVGLFVSKPFLSRLTGKWQIGLSRRIENPDGSFAGVVIGTLQLSYLNSLYAGLNVGQDGSITLFRTDGTVITREPYSESDVRRSLGGADSFAVIRSSRTGSFEGPSPIDGVQRIISFHRVGKLPLIQDVEVSANQAYSAWWHKALITATVLGVLCVTCLALMWLLGAELRRRVAIEATLQRLAATDPLTGLANRRRFDEAMALEWRRAMREHRTVSLLMIDADCFKSFNDVEGHLAGDDLLRAFARCIQDTARRPGDVPARYGGEEFAVLLTETDAAGAAIVAEAIRTAILAMARPHQGSPIQIATVSIGIATLRPVGGEDSAILVAAADTALYQAKADGRNCCRVAEQPKRLRSVAA